MHGHKNAFEMFTQISSEQLSKLNTKLKAKVILSHSLDAT